MTNLQLELGKTYQIRNGDIVKCIAIWSEPDCYGYQATCIFETGTDQGTSFSYDLNGRSGAGLNPWGKPYDIIQEIKE